jgi:hypothetical protein
VQVKDTWHRSVYCVTSPSASKPNKH